MMIVEMMFNCDYPLILKQYSRAVKQIARLDYPDKWATLLSNDIRKLLTMEGEKAVYTGLLCLLAVV
jgi:hypothetical protein